MTSLAIPLASYILNALWLLPVVAIAAWTASRLARQLGPAVAHRISVAALFAAILLPALPSARTYLQNLPAHASRSSNQARTASHLGNAPLPLIQGSLVLSPTTLHIVCALWLCGFLFCFIQFLRSFRSTLSLLRRASPCQLPPIWQLYWAQTQQHFRTQARLLKTTDITSPVTLALGHHVLLLPADFLDHATEADARTAFAHECAHMHRHDFLKNLLYRAAALPIAFHPATWLLQAKVAQSREILCDALAVQHFPNPGSYARSLLRLASMAATPPSRDIPLNAIGVFDANILEERIMQLQTPQPPPRAALRYLLIAALTLCLPLSIAIAAAAPLVSVSDTTPTLKIGKAVSAPILTFQVEPEFPAAARAQAGAFSGTCRLALVVDAAGLPRHVHVVQSLGKGFDENAIKSVEQYRFNPAMHSGKPVPVAISIEVNFQKF